MSKKTWQVTYSVAGGKLTLFPKAKDPSVQDADPPPCPHDGIDSQGRFVGFNAARLGDRPFAVTFGQNTKPKRSHLFGSYNYFYDQYSAPEALARRHRPIGDSYETNSSIWDVSAMLQRQQTIELAQTSLQRIAFFLPKRIRDEEIGDALEDLQRIVSDPACPNVGRAVRWKIASTWFWLLVHAARELLAAFRGKRTE